MARQSKREPPVGSGERFRRCVASVAARGTALDPKAVCAAIGRKKYGRQVMAELARRGRARRRNPPEAVFYLRDYLQPRGKFPYEQLPRDLEAELAAGKTVYLFGSAGSLVLAGHPGMKKPWHDAIGDRWYPTARQALGLRAKRGKRSNPSTDEQAAAVLSELFHGRPARSVREVASVEKEPDALADLGRLLELDVTAPAGARRLQFRGDVRLAADPATGQLLIVGGDQRLDLAALGVEEPRRYVLLGKLTRIVYRTSKAFHNFEPADYEHEFRRPLPSLAYDTVNRQISILGGGYEVRPEGITG